MKSHSFVCCIWLLSLNIVSLWFTHAVAFIGSSSFSGLSSIPLFEGLTFCLSNYLLIDIWIVSNIQQLYVDMNLNKATVNIHTHTHRVLCIYMCSVLLGRFSGVEQVISSTTMFNISEAGPFAQCLGPFHILGRFQFLCILNNAWYF